MTETVGRIMERRQTGASQLFKENMKLSKEKRFLIMLNHEARELLQIMATIQLKLEANEKPNPEVEQLKITLDFTWKAIMLQIGEVSNYLKDDEDVLQAYSEARAENPEPTRITQYHDDCKDNDLEK